MKRTYKVGLDINVTGSAQKGLARAAKASEGLARAAKSTRGASAGMASGFARVDLSASKASVGMATLTSGMRSANASAASFGQSLVSSSSAAAANVGSMAAKMTAAAGVAGMGLMAAKGFEFNAAMEKSTNRVASVLQLFGHSANAADQLGSNIKVAEASMARLVTIANASPGELKDVSNLFQNMLPGARSITGSMERIMTLTQKATMMTPALGGDFGVVGAQLSRMMTGGAGAEMETWKTLQSNILKAGQAMNVSGSKTKKIFADTMEQGEKLSAAFNKLVPEDRLRLIEAAFSTAGDDMAKMFAESWEGASSTFISGWREISGALTKPVFEAVKKGLVRATGEGGVFNNEAVKRMKNAAASIGQTFVGSAEKAFAWMESAIQYLQDHWREVANSAYHALQIGAGLIKGAFAFGLTKMMVGASLMAASKGASAVGKVGGMVGGAFKGGGGLAVALPALKMLGTALLPMAAVAAVAAVAFGGLALALGGVAAYVVSKWDEMLGSIRSALASGALSFKPLVTAAMIAWERLKILGEALLGGATGADMMGSAVSGAQFAVELLSDAVVWLIELAADLYDMVADVKGFFGVGKSWADVQKDWAWLRAGSKAAEAEDQARAEAAQSRGVALDAAAKAAGLPGFFSEGNREVDAPREKAQRMREAAARAREVGLKDLNLKDVDTYSKRLEDMLTAGDDSKDPKKIKGAQVNVGTLNINNNLRDPDPDRAMAAFVQPLEKLGKMAQTGRLSLGSAGF